ncbi:expressed unknown protein [Seminavis robusta]|uniref:Uncharacterized protein n=1 Tax=Seminavis robusta TaxID=568900 RepID=A0A9N8E2K4_9STRA|nr:expressed unknown protein [Seminavis robusta]|eukprot:Sro589_g171800.1 n/a (211) ;mRNA; f:44681-45464
MEHFCCEESSHSNMDHPKHCVCAHFRKDPFLRTARIASISATTIAWMWWPTLVLAIPIVSILQATWCTSSQMRKCGLYAAAVLACIAFVEALYIAIQRITECGNNLFLDFMDDDNRYRLYHEYHQDSPYCYTGRVLFLGAAAVVDAALFLLVAVSTTYFAIYHYDAALAKSIQDAEEAQDDERHAVLCGMQRSHKLLKEHPRNDRYTIIC